MSDDLGFQAPQAVMQTAIAARNGSKSPGSIELWWDVVPSRVYPMPGCVGIFYFVELQAVSDGGALRQFDMTINGKLWSKKPYTPQHLASDAFFNSEAHQGFTRYNLTLNTTAKSTLPPTINAAEFFSVVSIADVATDAKDVAAIAAIKAKYQVKKRNWAGDPCSPKALAWDGLNCSYTISMPPRITRLNMSFGGLSGDISSYFGNLKAIKDLTGNQLNGSIPSGLMKRIQDGSLTLRYGKNPNLCNNGTSCQPTKKKSSSVLAVYIVVQIVAVALAAALAAVLLIARKKQGSGKGSVKPQDEASSSQNGEGQHSLLQLENRRFTYRELEAMESNFQRVLGRGGFGSVYDGFLPDGTQVAVKLRSESSKQGVREFLTKAQTLMKIHHKNLVSVIGYCKDGECMALVYEHMSEGNLEDKLRGKDHNAGSLTWKQRLRIALESVKCVLPI